ncbi:MULTISPECIES: BACON domain-containing protein [Petrimonas]|jgi:hypothetical protein|uniref:BACON domain-containing protein n=1 Tax=Petrimonas TaxID=307628 RepID=UPI001751B7F1|nr:MULTISPECIES: BACON domain-containing carbohydrate-binding protein [Petrimonas]HHT29547.1 DNA-binding protein [Petrimonas mucosa]
MKIKYLFPLFVAVIALMVGCDDENMVTLLDEIQVSSSYVAIPKDGGSTTITVTAKESWTAEKVVTSKDSVKWLKLSATSGSAGESQLTFSAESTLDGRTAEVLIKCAGKTQRINVIQGLAQIEEAKVSEVNAGPDGKTYQVTGICTAISNTEYGNWYLTDETGTLYIYGTLDAKGGKKNFLSLGLEVGDEVTVQGPKTTYQTTVELVDVTVIKINKSLVKVDSLANSILPEEGGEAIAYITCKGQGVSVDIPEDAKSWLAISSIQSSGTSTVVKFVAAPNTGGDRSTTITFRTTDGKKEYTSETSLYQKGAIIDASVAEFLAAPVGNTLYRLSGVITEIKSSKYGNLYLRDFSGETYVYGVEGFESLGLKVGDVLTIIGKRAEYNGDAQVGSGVMESMISVTPATIAEVLAKPDSNVDYFMVTGEITSVANPTYGNLYLNDGENELYVFGCYPGWGATGDFRKNLLADKNIQVGDTLTVIGTKGSYKGVAQLTNGIYFSHVSAAE